MRDIGERGERDARKMRDNETDGREREKEREREREREICLF